MILHPDAQRLLQFAEGITPESDGGRVSEHLAACPRCRAEVLGLRDVQELLRLEPAPAPEALLGRVLDSRALNMLVMLPLAFTAKPAAPQISRRMLVLIGVGVAAVALVSLVPGGGRSWRPAMTAAMPDSIIEAFPPAGPFNMSRLHPVDLWYDETTTARDSTVAVVHERIRIRLRRMEPEGSGWLVVSDHGDHSSAFRDTVALEANSLRPIYWSRYNRLETGYEGKVRYTLTDSAGDEPTVIARIGGSPATSGMPSTQDVRYPLRSHVAATTYVSQANLIPLLMAMELPAELSELSIWRGRFAELFRSTTQRNGRGVWHLVPADFQFDRGGLAKSSDVFIVLRKLGGLNRAYYGFQQSDGILRWSLAKDLASGTTVEMRLVTIDGKAVGKLPDASLLSPE